MTIPLLLFPQSIHTLLMLLFCPLCGGLLVINTSQTTTTTSSFICKSCVYTFPISDKSYSARVELTRKKVDDVLGGEDAWKNVDSTDGNALDIRRRIIIINVFILYIDYIHIIFTLYPVLSHYLTLYPHPILLATCPKCENSRAYFMQIQIRSADEPSSIFYKCCRNSCGHQWREG